MTDMKALRRQVLDFIEKSHPRDPAPRLPSSQEQSLWSHVTEAMINGKLAGLQKGKQESTRREEKAKNIGPRPNAERSLEDPAVEDEVFSTREINGVEDVEVSQSREISGVGDAEDSRAYHSNHIFTQSRHALPYGKRREDDSSSAGHQVREPPGPSNQITINAAVVSRDKLIPKYF